MKIKNSCRGKGCSIRSIVLPSDKRIQPVLGNVHAGGKHTLEVPGVPEQPLGQKRLVYP